MGARSNPAPDVVELRIKNSVATRINKGAKNLGMTEEKYQSISSGKRYEIKIWLEEHPDKTWQDYPVYGQHIPKGISNKRMIAGAVKYGVDLKRYSSLSDSGRRSFRKRHANGKRYEALFQGLN